MRLMQQFKKIRDGYVKRQVARFDIPAFAAQAPVRVQLVFGGRVQKVGFRMEVALLAARLGLTGCAQNLADGCVLVQVQGAPQRIAWLKNRMCTLKRIRVTQCTQMALPLQEKEASFEILREKANP